MIALDVEDRLPELSLHRIHGFERVVLEDFFADFIPEIFLRTEFRRIRRKIQQRDVVGNGKIATTVVGAPSRTSKMSCRANLRARTFEEDLEAVVSRVFRTFDLG